MKFTITITDDNGDNTVIPIEENTIFKNNAILALLEASDKDNTKRIWTEGSIKVESINIEKLDGDVRSLRVRMTNTDTNESLVLCTYLNHTTCDETNVVTKKYLYHRTTVSNIESILKEGIKTPTQKYRAYVCLSENPISWYCPGYDDQEVKTWDTFGDAVFEIDFESYIKDNPDVHVKSWLPQSDEINVWGNIPPKYIRLISEI